MGTEERHMRRMGVLGGMSARPVEAIVLGCTEIPLLLHDESDAADLISPGALLADAAVRFAIEARRNA
jgi:aspartate/glutamate racemase